MIERLNVIATVGEREVFQSYHLTREHGAIRAKLHSPADDDLAIDVVHEHPDQLSFELTTSSLFSGVRIEYVTELDNFDRVIFPDTGRWFVNSLSPISAWRFRETTAVRINSFATPVFVFEHLGGDAASAIGLLTETREMDIRIHEPASNRALNVQHRRFRVEYELGPTSAASGAGLKFGWVSTGVAVHDAWFDALRRFSDLEQEWLSVEYAPDASSLAPYWCSWVDWSSDQMDQTVFTDNVKAGLDLGFQNFVLDDGWFGPGLDSDYDTVLNIGDWQPDTVRFPDMSEMLEELHVAGAKVLLWCAPHAVGPASNSYGMNAGLLVEDSTGTPIINSTMFYSLCFRSREARAKMLSVVENLVATYQIDGLKFDLFNWLPSEPCAGVHHHHDTESAMAGLVTHLAEARERVDRIGRPMTIELKQDYASPQAAVAGTVVRAGDAPYASKTNLDRMVYMQARNLPALNDYQTFPPSVDANNVALIGMRMIAGGIPAWGKDLRSLTSSQRNAMLSVHRWYRSLRDRGLRHVRDYVGDGLALIPLEAGTVLVQTEARRIADLPSSCVELANASTDSTVTVFSEVDRVIVGRLDLTNGAHYHDNEIVPAGTSRIPLSTGHVAVFLESEGR
ncbi:alpha-galactosidase [Microbacterium suaedae]|uniref:alpha-galactosidase n=1 Tax=Microbacterium suaedae TaxID=2067813 RepID=UPI000DA18588|nr:alpha-galactosidase [Microbacterium suaedae]